MKIRTLHANYTSYIDIILISQFKTKTLQQKL